MRNSILIGGAVLIGLLIVGGLVYTNYFSNTGSPVAATTTDQVATPTSPAGYTIKAVPENNDIRSVMPSLTRKIEFTDSVPENARTALTAKINLFKAKLEKDPTQANDWLDLALWYHSANDYSGAKEIWEFLEKYVPADTTSLDNLGKLYHYDLKQYVKAEQYFNKSISVNPNLITPYLELHSLYRYSYKMDTTAAVDILEKAAKQFPNETDPLALLGDYWKSKKEYAKARSAYEGAIDRARAAQNINLINAFGEELAKLPQ